MDLCRSLSVWLVACLLMNGLAACSTQPTLAPRPRPQPPSLQQDIQRQLLRDASLRLDQGQPGEAIRALTRLLVSPVDPRMLSETRWLLGQAYERVGNPASAAEQYQQILTASDGTGGESSVVRQARMRLETLHLSGSLPHPGSQFVVASWVLPEQVPSRASLSSWVAHLARSGVTAILLPWSTGHEEVAPKLVKDGRDLQTQAVGLSQPVAGVYFHTTWAPVVRSLFNELVPVAHQQGLSVFVVVGTAVNWLDTRMGWADTVMDPVLGGTRVSASLDWGHPSVKEYMQALVIDAANTGVDGVLFVLTPEGHPWDGVGADRVSEFERLYHVKLDVADLLRQKSSDRGPRMQGGSLEKEWPRDGRFWHWVGWKTKERMGSVTRMQRALRAQFPGLQTGIVMHDEAIQNPVVALVQYGEDVVEAKRAKLDVLLLQLENTHNTTQIGVLLEQAKGRWGDISRVWTMDVAGTTQKLRVPSQGGSSGIRPGGIVRILSE